MSKSRSVSGSVTGGTISIDASYAQELVEFWTGKYEQVKEELDQMKVCVPRCSPEDRRRISLTIGTTPTRKPPSLLRHHLEVVPATPMRGGPDPAQPRSSESRITGFPTPKAAHTSVSRPAKGLKWIL